MIYKKINLQEEFPCLHKPTALIAYCPDNSEEISLNRKRRSLLLLPGGAYRYNSDREAEPIALRFLGYDINVFLLDYNDAPFEPPYPFLEGFAAIAYLRRHAEEYHIDSAHIAAIGFSAGGHFAASLGAFYDKKPYADILKATPEEIKPDGIILCYPVISMDSDLTEKHTAMRLLEKAPEKKEEYSIEKQVTSSFPPTFIWASGADMAVNSINSILLAAALKRNGVRLEFHHYPFGEHGGSLADRSVYPDDYDPNALKDISYCQDWFLSALRFIKEAL